jgi:hypothetical protein
MSDKYDFYTDDQIKQIETSLDILCSKQKLYIENLSMNLKFAVSDLNKMLEDVAELSDQQYGTEIRSIISRKNYYKNLYHSEVRKLLDMESELELAKKEKMLRAM